MFLSSLVLIHVTGGVDYPVGNSVLTRCNRYELGSEPAVYCIYKFGTYCLSV